MRAAASGRIDIVETLLLRGADVNEEDRKGITAMMVAARYGHAEIVQLLRKTEATR